MIPTTDTDVLLDAIERIAALDPAAIPTRVGMLAEIQGRVAQAVYLRIINPTTADERLIAAALRDNPLLVLGSIFAVAVRLFDQASDRWVAS